MVLNRFSMCLSNCKTDVVFNKIIHGIYVFRKNRAFIEKKKMSILWKKWKKKNDPKLNSSYCIQEYACIVLLYSSEYTLTIVWIPSINKVTVFTFFYTHKNKVLDSRKFSKSSFRWIYMLWDVLNTIWSFLENVCLSVGLSVCTILWTLYLKNNWAEIDET